MRTSKVTQSLGFTVNMGNYESARVDVSVEIEATSDEDTVRRAAHHIDQAPVRNWELRLPEPSPKVVQESYIGDDSELDEF